MVQKITPYNITKSVYITTAKDVSSNSISVFGDDIGANDFITEFDKNSQTSLIDPRSSSKYITEKKNKDYTVQKGDTPDSIAQKYGVETVTLLALNGLDKDSARYIQIGQTLKIPPTMIVKNVNKLVDVVAATGLSENFIKGLKLIEDGHKIDENHFHNTIYKDEATKSETIGIGHLYKTGEPKYLSDSQVCTLLVKDILKTEENIRYSFANPDVYDNLPEPIKEALIDMAFNKGVSIITDTPGLMYCLKEGKYEAAINKMTSCKATTNDKEYSGLCKRRLFDISRAMEIYQDNTIPQSNINTIQILYNHGVELLREECKKNKLSFEDQIRGFNEDIALFYGDKVNIKFITA